MSLEPPIHNPPKSASPKRERLVSPISIQQLEPLRPYDLRHACATLLLANGEHPKVVAERSGHASTVMTLDVYYHVLPDMQEAAAQRLEDLLASTMRWLVLWPAASLEGFPEAWESAI